MTMEKHISPAAGSTPAPGSGGFTDLYTVDHRTAAILMAIVADHLGAPLNELRFISIKEVTSNEISSNH